MKQAFHQPLKKLFLFAAFIFIQTTGYGQVSPINEPVTDTGLTAVETRLVELALKGPAVQEAIHRNKISEYEIKAQKMNWVNLLTISTNYNDQSFRNTPAAAMFPRYFFGFTLPLGTILSRTNVRSAEEAAAISRNNEAQLRRNIKAEVLGKYRQYRAIGQLIVIQRELIDDVQAALLTNEENFRKGLITVEAYNQSQKVKNDAAAQLINLQLQQDLVKLDIERMIGQPLESVTGR